MKRKHKKKVAIATLCIGPVLFIIGAFLKQTMPPSIPMSDPGWFERESARGDREMWSYALMGGAVFIMIIAIQELLRQARKLKLEL